MTRPIVAIVTGGSGIDEALEECVRSISEQSLPVRIVLAVNAGPERLILGDWQADPSSTAADHAIHCHLGTWGQEVALSLIRQMDPETVVCWVDGDDALNGPDALATVLREYDQGALMTYGSYVAPGSPWTQRRLVPYTSLVHVRGIYRRVPWRAVAMRTHLAGLLQSVPEASIRLPGGAFPRLAFDHALAFPLLERARSRAHFIEAPIYRYRWDHPGSAWSRGPQYLRAQYAEAQRIRQRTRLESTERGAQEATVGSGALGVW